MSIKANKTGYIFMLALLIHAALFLLCGCAGETLAGGITTKNVSGNGTVIDSHIGIDTDTKIPELETVFISGDFSTAKAGTNAVTYREESSSSMWNASSTTTKRFLSITLTEKGDLAAVIKAVAEVIANSGKNTADSGSVAAAAK